MMRELFAVGVALGESVGHGVAGWVGARIGAASGALSCASFLSWRTSWGAGLLTLALQAPLALAHQHDAMELDELMGAFGWNFEATQVRTEKVTDSLYVLFGIGGNVGVSVGPNGTLVVDDQFPQMMPKLKAAMGELGSEGVDFAV